MEDIARNDDIAREVAAFIDECRGLRTVALYVGARRSFTDHFIITTCTSAGHMRGLVHNLMDFLDEKSIQILNRRKVVDEQEWVVLDCRVFVVHIFSEEKRSFYDLERLWFDGESVYSSKSSSS
jgi:ribosome-associated protein